MRTDLKHTIVLILGTGITAALSLVYHACAGRLLGPADYAVFATAVSFVMLCQIALGPINGTVARFTAQYSARGESGKVRTLARSATRSVAVYGAGVVLLAVPLAWPLAKFLQFDSVRPLLVAYAVIWLTLLLSVSRGLLRGVQRFTHLSINTVFEAGIRLAAGAALLLCLPSAVAGLGAYLIGLAAMLFVARYQVRPIWGPTAAEPFDAAAARRFAGPLLVMMTVAAGCQHLDMLFVKHYFAESEAGLYGAATNLARALAVLVTPFTTMLLPLLTREHEHGRSVRASLLRICTYFLLAAAGPLVLFGVWPEQIIVLLYGADYHAAGALLLPLAGVRLLGFLSEMLALAGAAANRFGFLLIYVPALMAEIVALRVWHQSLTAVLTILLVVQGGTLVAMTTGIVLTRPRTTPTSL